MANIKITVDGPLEDGHKITFKAPCDCGSAGKLEVFYIEEYTQMSRLFTLKDANKNTLSGNTNMFAHGAYVSVVLDTNAGYAYVQNAASSAKIENDMAILRGTLNPGTTVITFSDPRIKGDTVFSFYSSIYGVNPERVMVGSGIIQIIWPAQEKEMEVGVRIDG